MIPAPPFLFPLHICGIDTSYSTINQKFIAFCGIRRISVVPQPCKKDFIMDLVSSGFQRVKFFFSLRYKADEGGTKRFRVVRAAPGAV